MASPDRLTRDTVLRRSSGVLAERLLDETVVLHPGVARYTRLNAAGTLLWEGLDEPVSLGSLADRLVEQFGIGRARALADARSFVRSLLTRDLLVLAESRGSDVERL